MRARTDATTTAGAVSGRRIRQIARSRAPMAAAAGLICSNGSVSQAGRETAASRPSQLCRSAQRCSAATSLIVHTTTGRRPEERASAASAAG